MKKMFGKIKQALKNANKVTVYPLGYIEETPRFEYEIKNDDSLALKIKFIGPEFLMKLDVSMIVYSGEEEIKRERLFYDQMGDDGVSIEELILIRGAETADRVCIKYTEGEHMADDHYQSGAFCINLRA